MNEFHAGQFPAPHLGGVEFGDAAREFRSVQITNPHDVAGVEFTFTARNAGRQQTFARFTQRLFCAVIHEQRAFGMMKECNPAFASGKLRRMRNENSPLVFAGRQVSAILLA